MPTAYVEAPVVTPSGTDGSFELSGTVALETGDSFQGEVGQLIGPGEIDGSDTVLLQLVEGATYTFTVDLPDNGETLIFGVFGDTSPGDSFTRLGNSSETQFSATFTAQADELGLMSISGTGTYLISVSVTYSLPTEGNDTLTGNMTADRLDLLGGDDVFVALGGSDVVSGGTGNDMIDGVCGNDTLNGNDGNDTLIGGNGRDALFGGDDDDNIDGGNQEDLLSGDGGNDSLTGDKGEDTLVGGAGNDTLLGGDDHDLMTGGDGSDIFVFMRDDGQDTITDFVQGEDVIDITGMGIWDISQFGISDSADGVRINTGNGSFIELVGLSSSDLTNTDFVLADAPPPPTTTEGGDTLTGTSGADALLGGAGSDKLAGGDGADTLDGGSGRDTLYGNAGSDVINGGSGQDQLLGGRGHDTIFGDADNDLIYGNNGRDLINGGNANDRIYGNSGQDTLIGEHGNDRLYGGGGHDLIEGGAGKDIIEGNNGNDTIEGGAGDDLMTGGNGLDVFEFLDDATRADTITDFTIGQDLIRITAYGFNDISDLNAAQVGDDVVITLSQRDSITLQSIQLSDLSNTDFDFGV